MNFDEFIINTLVRHPLQIVQHPVPFPLSWSPETDPQDQVRQNLKGEPIRLEQ